MNTSEIPRVMWLLNHGTARDFELNMLKQLGVKEIYLPKKMPANLRSASIDFSEDIHLTIPPDDLAYLNQQNWYDCQDKKAWRLANHYFQVIFFICHEKNAFTHYAHFFKGILIWRTYGLDKDSSYTGFLARNEINADGILDKTQNRFFFGEAYHHLHEIEQNNILKKNSLFLPAGLNNTESTASTWQGNLKKILFVCPEIQISSYYKNIYKTFITEFSEFSYLIPGQQSVKLDDPNVTGFLSTEQYLNTLRECRLMFYHSQEPRHIHYHPFEGIKAGVPLIFMANGLLDRLGGMELPGRCHSYSEAKEKIRRIFSDDWDFIEKIRSSQTVLLTGISKEFALPFWKSAWEQVTSRHQKIQAEQAQKAAKTKYKIAVILPAPYFGGTLRGAKLLAEALHHGSVYYQDKAEIVFGYLDHANYRADEFSDLNPNIQCRPFHWTQLSSQQAQSIMQLEGKVTPLPEKNYLVPDDGANFFCDCQFWIFVSDRIHLPILPIRSYAIMIYDYLQRYFHIMPETTESLFIKHAHQAEQVWVTTAFTQGCAEQYAYIPTHKIRLLPMLPPLINSNINPPEQSKMAEPYFLWTSNPAKHKNLTRALWALSLYYSQYQGKLKCYLCGVDTDQLKNIINQSETFHFEKEIHFLNYLSDESYQTILSQAEFLWHPCLLDNGTFSAIEAAQFGIPTLSSRYPAMEEISEQFSIPFLWMDPFDANDMAEKLKEMEIHHSKYAAQLPDPEIILAHSTENLGRQYWNAIKECL